jgi:hypothetical protein
MEALEWEDFVKVILMMDSLVDNRTMESMKTFNHKNVALSLGIFLGRSRSPFGLA